MCRLSVVFYAECGHINTRAARCPILYCQSVDRCHTIYSPIRLCPACLSDLSNPCPSPDLVAARSRYFFRRSAREDLADQRQAADRERQTRDVLASLNAGTRPTYSLTSPFTAQPALLTILDAQTAAAHDSDCVICGGAYTDCALIGGDWDGKEFPVRLPCHKDHVFGVVCIMTWFAKSSSCPLCRCEFAIDRTLGVDEPFVFRFLDGPPRVADLADPLLEDLDNVELDGEIDDTPDGLEYVDADVADGMFIYEEALDEESEVEVRFIL